MQQANHNPILGGRTAEDRGRFNRSGQSEKAACDLLNEMFEYVVENKCSDIHIRINEYGSSSIRIRQDGDMRLWRDNILPENSKLLKVKICSKSKLNDQERRVPQDGRINLFFCGRQVDGRISLIPTLNGFKIVCRILDSNNSKLDIDQFEVSSIIKATLKRIISNPEGLFIASGPTGSGKTTTLYSSLNYLNRPEVSIVTIEDPVEYSNEDFEQISVSDTLTFAVALTSVVRQDPDVIMVGEMRDFESASVAISAAGTGHMVLTTTHSLDTIETLRRIQDLGLSRAQIGAVLSGVVAQRLVRRIPDDIDIEWCEPNDIEKKWLLKHGAWFDGVKLPKVDKRIMTGRIPMVELLEVTPEIRLLISDNDVSKEEIMRYVCLQPQFETLSQAGVRLVLSGKTTLSEVMLGMRDSSSIPTTKRFEQVLMERGWLTVGNLDLAFQYQIEQQAIGAHYSLEEILHEFHYAKPEHIEIALQIAEGIEPEPFLVPTISDLKILRSESA